MAGARLGEGGRQGEDRDGEGETEVGRGEKIGVGRQERGSKWGGDKWGRGVKWGGKTGEGNRWNRERDVGGNLFPHPKVLGKKPEA